MKVKLVCKTAIDNNYLQHLINEYPDQKDFINTITNVESLMIFIARVSSPNQANPSYEKLLKYCIDHKHWSIFEQIDFTFEVQTSLAIATQLLRHKTMFFQQFSQRYATISEQYEDVECRRQDVKNRQNSISDLNDETLAWWEVAKQKVWNTSFDLYEEALKKGIAKECARFLLPSMTSTKLYAKASLRTWIHYLEVRNNPATQKEHQQVAELIQNILSVELPIVAKACNWVE